MVFDLRPGSRQKEQGAKARRKHNKEMKSIIDDLRRENNELRGEDVKKTEQLAVLEKKLKVSEVELEKANNKIEAWETECKNVKNVTV